MASVTRAKTIVINVANNYIQPLMAESTVIRHTNMDETTKELFSQIKKVAESDKPTRPQLLRLKKLIQQKRQVELEIAVRLLELERMIERKIDQLQQVLNHYKSLNDGLVAVQPTKLIAYYEN